MFSLSSPLRSSSASLCSSTSSTGVDCFQVCRPHVQVFYVTAPSCRTSSMNSVEWRPGLPASAFRLVFIADRHSAPSTAYRRRLPFQLRLYLVLHWHHGALQIGFYVHVILCLEQFDSATRHALLHLRFLSFSLVLRLSFYHFLPNAFLTINSDHRVYLVQGRLLQCGTVWFAEMWPRSTSVRH